MCTWEKWQWWGAPHSQKPQYHRKLTIRLFSVISRTLVEGFFYPSAELQSEYSTVPADWAIHTVDIVTWSTTERREIRNFPCPSVFELTGRQRLTVKRGIRNVGQFLAAEVVCTWKNGNPLPEAVNLAPN